MHVQGGMATVRDRRGVRAVDLGTVQLDLAVAEIAALTASAMRREISAQSPILEQRIPAAVPGDVLAPVDRAGWPLGDGSAAAGDDVIPLSRGSLTVS